MKEKLLLLIVLIVLGIGFFPHHRYFDTTYYSNVEGSRAETTIARYNNQPERVTVILFDYPTSEYDWEYADFVRYDFRFYTSLLASTLIKSGPDGITYWRITIPGCCEQPTIGGYISQIVFSYDQDDDSVWSIHVIKPRDYCKWDSK